MKSWCAVVIFSMVSSDIYSSSSAQPDRVFFPHNEVSSKSIDTISELNTKVKNGKKKLRVCFSEEEKIVRISPRIKKEKPGSRFSHEAAPVTLKNDARAALAALAQAKAPVVFSFHDETVSMRPLRCELLNAEALLQDAPKRIAAAQKACEDVLDQLKILTITATRIKPVKRSNAFIRRSVKKDQ